MYNNGYNVYKNNSVNYASKEQLLLMLVDGAVKFAKRAELGLNEKKELQRKQSDLISRLQEIKEYDEKIAHIANKRICLNLDDGVLKNYSKFEDILAKIK